MFDRFRFRGPIPLKQFTLHAILNDEAHNFKLFNRVSMTVFGFLKPCLFGLDDVLSQ